MDYEAMVKKKRMAGIAIIVVGLILGMLAYILDLVTTGTVHSSSTPLYLLIGGLMVSVLGAIYIGAGSTEAIRLLNKQVRIMKSELSEKEKTIDDQKKGLETLSDNRLTGLSPTVDRLEMLEKENAKAAAAKAAEKPPEKPAEAPAPKQAWEKNLDAKRAEKTTELPPPPPKSMVVPGPAKPIAPQTLPPPPPGLPKGQALPPPPPKSMQVTPPPKPVAPPPPVVAPKPVVPAPGPVPKPVAPAPAMVAPAPVPAVVPPSPTNQEETIAEVEEEEGEPEEKEPEQEVSEEEDTADEGAQEKKYQQAESAKQKAEEKEYENEKAEVEADAMGVDEEELLPSTTCPRCHNTFKGDWEHCPFCDFNLKAASKAEAPAAAPPKTEPAPASSGISILGYTPKKTQPEPAPAVTAPPAEPKKIPVVPMEERFTEPLKSVEAKPLPPSIVPPLPDFQRTMTSAPPAPPVDSTQPPAPVARPAGTSKDKCPGCGKTIKPHWRNCPYCKATLK